MGHTDDVAVQVSLEDACAAGCAESIAAVCIEAVSPGLDLVVRCSAWYISVKMPIL
jgi:hypothetical protein